MQSKQHAQASTQQAFPLSLDSFQRQDDDRRFAHSRRSSPRPALISRPPPAGLAIPPSCPRRAASFPPAPPPAASCSGKQYDPIAPRFAAIARTVRAAGPGDHQPLGIWGGCPACSACPACPACPPDDRSLIPLHLSPPSPNDRMASYLWQHRKIFEPKPNIEFLLAMGHRFDKKYAAGPTMCDWQEFIVKMNYSKKDPTMWRVPLPFDPTRVVLLESSLYGLNGLMEHKIFATAPFVISTCVLLLLLPGAAAAGRCCASCLLLTSFPSLGHTPQGCGLPQAARGAVRGGRHLHRPLHEQRHAHGQRLPHPAHLRGLVLQEAHQLRQAVQRQLRHEDQLCHRQRECQGPVHQGDAGGGRAHPRPQQARAVHHQPAPPRAAGAGPPGGLPGACSLAACLPPAAAACRLPPATCLSAPHSMLQRVSIPRSLTPNRATAR